MLNFVYIQGHFLLQMALMYDGLVMNHVEMKMDSCVIMMCVWRRMGCGNWGGKEAYLCRKGVIKIRKKRKKKALAKQRFGCPLERTIARLSEQAFCLSRPRPECMSARAHLCPLNLGFV